MMSIASFGSFAGEATQLDWQDLRPEPISSQVTLPEITYQQKQTLQQIFTLSQYNDSESANKITALKEKLKSEA